MESDPNRYLEIHQSIVIEVNQIPIIARISNYRVVKVINKLNIKVIPSSIDYNPPFNIDISINIRDGSTIAASNILMKNDKLGGYQKIISLNNTGFMEHEIQHKE